MGKYYPAYRRRRAGLTNYRKRLRLIKSKRPRIAVRKTLKSVIVQFIAYAERGDAVLASANSAELGKYGWKAGANLPAAYLTGLLCGYRALKAGVREGVADLGLHSPTKNSAVFVALRGVADAGVSTAAPELDAGRVRGEHISSYAKLLKGKPGFERQFSQYLKNNVDPEKIPEMFDAAKGGITREYNK